MTTRPATVVSTTTDPTGLAASGPLSDGSPVGAAVTVLALLGLLVAASFPLAVTAVAGPLVAGALARSVLIGRGRRRGSVDDKPIGGSAGT